MSGNMSSKFQPYYDVRFFFNNIDFSLTTQSITIYSGINAVYESIRISFLLDQQKITKEEMYGQKECKLIITFVTEDAKQGDSIEFDLQIIDFKQILKTMEQNSEQEDLHPMGTVVSIIAIPKLPMNYMSTHVNLVVPEDKSTTPFNIVNNIINHFIPNVKKDIKPSGKNATNVRQCLIPPLPFTAAIDGLDREFSIYEGPLFFQCRNEENTLSMWDLSKQIEEPVLYTVGVLSDDGKGNINSTMFKKAGADSIFYTKSQMNFGYAGQLKVLKEGYNQIYFKKPVDKLFEVVKTNMDDIFKNNTAKDGGKLHLSDYVKERFKIHNGINSNESDANIKSQLARKLMDSTTIDFRMDRNLDMKTLIRVGVPIELIFENTRLIDHSGKYIVKGQTFTLTQSGIHYTALSHVHAFRANTLM